MSPVLARGAERLKLARLLHCEPERLAYLDKLDVEQVRALRERATDALFDADRERFQRVAAASRLPPAQMTAAIAQKAFGALLVARVTALVDADRAVDIAGRLPPEFLADVAVEIDPRRTSAVIAGIPPELTGRIAAELARREDHVAMGRFVGHLTEAGLLESLAVVDDPALLRIAYVLEVKERLDEVVRLMSAERRAATIRAATEHDLWPEALDLLANVSGELASELVAAALDQGRDDIVAGLLGAAEKIGDLDGAVRLLARLDADVRERLAPLIAGLKPARRSRVSAAAREAGVLDELGPVADAPTG